MTVDRESFKRGMRRFASGVCVVTTLARDGARLGLTATAMCSVSADPPTLLVSLNRATGTCTAIRAAGHFAVNLLSSEDRETSHRFGSPIPPEDRFSAGRWDTAATGSPVLASAVAVFDCRLSQVVDVATHCILVGDIQAVRSRELHVKPLLYLQGAYGGFAHLEGGDDCVQGRAPYRHAADLQFLEDGLHWGLM